MKKTAQVQIEILDARGRLLEWLSTGELPAGEQSIEWKTAKGSGLFFYRVLVDGDFVGAGRVVRVGR